MGIFSGIQQTVFSVCGSVFGSSATWQPSTGGDVQTATVLYKDPSKSVGLSDNDYNVEGYQLEYLAGAFVGLFEAVRQGESERVTVTTDEGAQLTFFVQRIKKEYDGKTFIAFLTPID